MPTDCQRWEVSLWTGVHPRTPSCQHPKQSKLSLPPTLPLYWVLSGDQLAPTFSYNSPVAPWCPGTHVYIKEHKTHIKYMCAHILTCTDGVGLAGIPLSRGTMPPPLPQGVYSKQEGLPRGCVSLHTWRVLDKCQSGHHCLSFRTFPTTPTPIPPRSLVPAGTSLV